MSDLQTQPPPTSSENSGDSLQKLHKMSRTAGLGSGDYAAVNGLGKGVVGDLRLEQDGALRKNGRELLPG